MARSTTQWRRARVPEIGYTMGKLDITNRRERQTGAYARMTLTIWADDTPTRVLFI
jgi:hypothetical protein